MYVCSYYNTSFKLMLYNYQIFCDVTTDVIIITIVYTLINYCKCSLYFYLKMVVILNYLLYSITY